MSSVTSKDGTSIAFDKSGSGPAIILISPALADRNGTAPVGALLSHQFTVFNYDRRGRGGSGDTAPYAAAREIEDIQALIHEAGGSASLYGWSSGAVLALDVASAGPGVTRLVLFEPPFIVDDKQEPIPVDYVARMSALIAADRRSDAVEFFMTDLVGVPSEYVSQMKSSPMWADMEKLAHTLPYDGIVMGDTMWGKPLPADRWSSATIPTLVLDGGESPEWMRNAAKAVADVLPNAEHRTLAGQNHGVAPEVLAPVLAEFFAN